MTPLPNYRPKQLSLGPLEAEILNLIWELGSATVRMCMNAFWLTQELTLLP